VTVCVFIQTTKVLVKLFSLAQRHKICAKLHINPKALNAIFVIITEEEREMSE